MKGFNIAPNEAFEDVSDPCANRITRILGRENGQDRAMQNIAMLDGLVNNSVARTLLK